MLKDHLSIAVLGVFATMPYAIIAPLLPLEILKRGLPQILTGLVFSAYGFSQLIAPTLAIRFLLPHVRHTRLALYSQALLGVSLFAYGIAQLFPSNALFVGLSFLARFCQGMAASVELTLIPTILAINLP